MRPQSASEKTTEEFLSLQVQHLLQFFVLGLATEMFPLVILASLNRGKSLLHWLLAINLVILAEVHVFLNPGTKKRSAAFVFHNLYKLFPVAVDALVNGTGPTFGRKAAGGSKVTLPQGL